MIKKIAQYPLKFVDGVLATISGAVSGICSAQFPQYLIHYIQRLGGHVDEAKLNVDKYEQAAENVGKTLEEYISLHINNPEPTFQETGKVIQSVVDRHGDLSSCLESVTSGNAVSDALGYIWNHHPEIAEKTYENFEWSFSFDAQTVGYGLVGLVLGYGLYKGVTKIASSLLFKKNEAGGGLKCN